MALTVQNDKALVPGGFTHLLQLEDWGDLETVYGLYSAFSAGAITPTDFEGVTITDLRFEINADALYLAFSGGAQISGVSTIKVTLDGIGAFIAEWNGVSSVYAATGYDGVEYVSGMDAASAAEAGGGWVPVRLEAIG